MKNYNNYAEQVKRSVKSMVLFNNYPKISQYYSDYLPTDLNNAIFEHDQDIYQWYLVEIAFENEETDKLGIFYDDDLEVYILPVTHSGMPWGSVSARDLRNEFSSEVYA